MNNHLVVIGGTAAGMSAASRARKLAPQLPITVFEKSGFVTYGSCGLPYFIGDVIKNHQDLITYTPDFLNRERHLNVQIHHEVTAIDLSGPKVTVKDLDNGKESEIAFSQLVIATGSSPIVPPIPGVNLQNIYTLRTVEDGIRIKDALAQGKMKKAAIVGGGFIGLEMAEALRGQGVEVLLFEALPRLLPNLDEKFSSQVQEGLTRNGVSTFMGTTIIEFGGDRKGQVSWVKTANEKVYDVDMVLLSVGVRPNSRLAKEAGLTLGFKEGIVVDYYMQISSPQVWACGDCVQMYNLVSGQPTYIPLGTTANKQGKTAGENAVGGKDSFPGVIGTSVTKVFETYIASTGLILQEAVAAGLETVTTMITKGDKASYYPGVQQNHIKLIMEKKSGRLLGAQMIGSESGIQRINVFVTAITAGFTVYQLNQLDLAYALPIVPVYDPVLVAATDAIKVLKKVKP